MQPVSGIRSRELMISAILIAMGILIPLIMPIKVVIGPASYTLASHVPIFIGLMISPFVALSVTLGTTLGFLLAGFPAVIVLRALSHFLFVLVAIYLIKQLDINHLSLDKQLIIYFAINIIHGLGEVLAVYFFSVNAHTTNTEGFFYTLWVLVGIGTVIHGFVDYLLARLIMNRVGAYN